MPTVAARCIPRCGACGSRPSSGRSSQGRPATCYGCSARSITGSGGRARGSGTGRAGTRTCGPTRREASAMTGEMLVRGQAPAEQAAGRRRRTKPPGRGVRGLPPGSAFRAALESGAFTVTAEIGPPRGADARRDRAQGRAAARLGGSGQHHRQPGRLRAAVQLGREPGRRWPPGSSRSCSSPAGTATGSRCSPSCWAPSAMGIPNILVMTGDHPRFGDHAERQARVRPGQRAAAAGPRGPCATKGSCCPAASSIPPPSWFLGSVENPSAPPAGLPRGPPGQEGRRGRAVRADPVRVRRRRVHGGG